MVGKRKRRADYAESNVEIGSHDKNGSERLQTLLRKHFEATYEPLDTAPSTPHQDNEKSSSGTDADEGDAGWSGISEDETANTVEVVDYTAASVTDDLASKEERKLFLVSDCGDWLWQDNPLTLHRAQNLHLCYSIQSHGSQKHQKQPKTLLQRLLFARMTLRCGAYFKNHIFCPRRPRTIFP